MNFMFAWGLERFAASIQESVYFILAASIWRGTTRTVSDTLAS